MDIRSTESSLFHEHSAPLLASSYSYGERSLAQETRGPPPKPKKERQSQPPNHAKQARSRSAERPPVIRNRAVSSGLTQPKHGRLINKTVPLPLEAPEPSDERTPEARHTINTYCIADGFRLNEIQVYLRERYPDSTLDTLAECLHCCLPRATDEDFPREMFFLEYGVIIFWGMSEIEVNYVIKSISTDRYMVDALSEEEVELDNFSVNIGAGTGSIANDMITLPPMYYAEWRIKMAISHALAQSSKLCVYEERMGSLVTSTKDMPTHLAKTGKVNRTRKEIAQLIGMVFIHKSNVNLLSSVMDTPEYFWAAPDSHQALYKRVTEYLELEQRITVLNNRFEVLTELLNIVHEHENNLHIARLEWIVIWLIVVEVVVGLLECASILGFVKQRGGV